MVRTRAAWAILVSMVAATAGGFGVTAQAATQTQGQSQALYTNQNQDVQTGGGATITQNASDTMSTSQTETTNTDANSSVPKDANQTVVNSKQSETMKGQGDFSESQNDQATATQDRSSGLSSVQLQNQVQTEATQSGMIQTTDKAEITQGQETLIENEQSQTKQYQVQATPQTMHVSYLPSKTSFAATDVIGYAFFDAKGDLLSDIYGVFPNEDNNGTRHYNAFGSYMPKTVVVKAVNAFGVPVNNATPITLYLRSNNFNSMFMLPHSSHMVNAVQLPAGTDGVQVVYMSMGAGLQFDVLDAGTAAPYVPHAPAPVRHAPVMVVGQTQQGTVSGTTATQNEQAALTSTQSPSASGTQTQQTSAKADANESQSVVMDNSDTLKPALQQTQQVSVDGQQDATNSAASANAWNETASQNTTSFATTPVQLSQHQTVAVDDYWQSINVTVKQTHTVDSGSTTLNQSLDVSVPTSGSQGNTRSINVTVGSHQYQYTIGTGAPVVFDEAQAMDTSKDNGVAETFDIHYGSTVFHVPTAD